jgi:hypothetical protein
MPSSELQIDIARLVQPYICLPTPILLDPALTKFKAASSEKNARAPVSFPIQKRQQIA